MTTLPGAEFRPVSELLPWQQARWSEQRAHVAASAFYRTLWDGTGPPADLRDLPALPLSDKSQLRAAQAETPPFGTYLAAPETAVVRLHRTSGTTGQAMNLALSSRDCRITEEVGGRCHRAAGLGPGHKVIHCLNYQMWMGGLTDHLTLESTGALVIPFGTGNTEHLIRTIREVGVTAISCTPSYPAVIARVLEERFPGVAPRDLGLKLGLFGGEAGLDDPALRERIRETWGMAPRNANYGVSDVFSNFAGQCDHDSRLHFMGADVLWPELIDPATGDSRALVSGADGELVLTHLVRDCQPLVRFRTGDIVAVDETEPCGCGRSGFRFRVIGRSDDMVVVRGINLFPTMVASVLGGFGELTGDYRIVLGPPPHQRLPLRVERRTGTPDDPTLGDRIEAAIKRHLGATATVEVLPPGSFPVTEGKTARVIRSLK